MMQALYTLVVQDPLHERQLRRLGAAVSLLWDRLPQTAKDNIVLQASMIHISGEAVNAPLIEEQLVAFLNARIVSQLVETS
jgi:hypothetical protein